MNRIHLIILSVVILVFSFLEVIVFDEEVLLALCFVCFIFFAYSYLSNSIYDIFEDRANKFESDLLLAFEEKYSQKLSMSKKLSVDKVLTEKISIFHSLETSHFDHLKTSILSKLISYVDNSTTILLNETLSLETGITYGVQQNKFERIIYTFISKQFSYMLYNS